MYEILIVDDNAVFRRVLKETLISKSFSMNIREASEGKEAFQNIKCYCPDLIFMDFKLPGENGYELTKRIKALYPQVVIIILTNHYLPEYREAAFQFGADYFLSKGSTTTDEILTIVESILCGTQAP